MSIKTGYVSELLYKKGSKGAYRRFYDLDVVYTVEFRVTSDTNHTVKSQKFTHNFALKIRTFLVMRPTLCYRVH